MRMVVRTEEAGNVLRPYALSEKRFKASSGIVVQLQGERTNDHEFSVSSTSPTITMDEQLVSNVFLSSTPPMQ